MRREGRDDRPFYALGAALLVLAALALAPPTRAWMADTVLAPLDAQVGLGGRPGYSFPSLLLWAAVGAAFAWAAYELVFRRLGFAPDRRFVLALAPWLLAAPLAHALLPLGILAPPWAYLAAEPPVYLTTALLVLAALVVGRLVGRAHEVSLGAGLVALVALALLAAPHVTGAGAGRAGLLLALAGAAAGVVTYAFHRYRPHESVPAVAAVVGAHALDGATTWMVLRDPFGLGFSGFGEKNPVSLVLVTLSNGWPYFALKLALPVALLLLIKAEAGEERVRSFLLLAIFVLGYGPGMANLLQVLLR